MSCTLCTTYTIIQSPHRASTAAARKTLMSSKILYQWPLDFKEFKSLIHVEEQGIRKDDSSDVPLQKMTFDISYFIYFYNVYQRTKVLTYCVCIIFVCIPMHIYIYIFIFLYLRRYIFFMHILIYDLMHT